MQQQQSIVGRDIPRFESKGPYTYDELYPKKQGDAITPFLRSLKASQTAAKWYRPIARGDAKIDLQVFRGGMVRRYLSSDVHVNRSFDVARLLIKGEVFMSTWPLEIESHINPINWAKGSVYVGGLGLGYYIQSILDKKEVTEIVCVERDHGVIQMYEEVFGTHPKLTVLNDSVFHYRPQFNHDFAYIDIWSHLTRDTVLSDLRLIAEFVRSERIVPWGIERLVCDALIKKQSMEDFLESFPVDLTWARGDIRRQILSLNGH